MTRAPAAVGKSIRSVAGPETTGAFGEISPKEFAQCIGKVLAHGHRVEYARRAGSGPIFNFYMGKNTPGRKDSIMDRLVVPVEE
ncbi:MAG TPA: hypothetical protein VNN22_10375 [Verrucomicrobiae bacterium]|nr:hypothetical protein [Verrucomicrobiae bacterium]